MDPLPWPAPRTGSLPQDAKAPIAARRTEGGRRCRVEAPTILLFFFIFFESFQWNLRGGKPLKQARSLSQAGHPELGALHL